MSERISQEIINHIESYGFNLEPCSTPKNEWNRMKRNFLYNNFYNPYKNIIKNNRLYYFLKRFITIKFKKEYGDGHKSFVSRPKEWHDKIQFEFTITPPQFFISTYEKYYTVHFGKNYDITRHGPNKNSPITITYSSHSSEYEFLCNEEELKNKLDKLFKEESDLLIYYRDNQLKKILNSLD